MGIEQCAVEFARTKAPAHLTLGKPGFGEVAECDGCRTARWCSCAHRSRPTELCGEAAVRKILEIFESAERDLRLDLVENALHAFAVCWRVGKRRLLAAAKAP